MTDELSADDAVLRAAQTVIEQTGHIRAKLQEVDDHLRIRRDAVRTLADLTDVVVDIMPASMSVTPYEDMVLLELYKAGQDGATRYHLKTVWRMRFGAENAGNALDRALDSLLQQGRIVHRGGSWAIAEKETSLPQPIVQGSMKDRVIHVLRTQRNGLKVQKISDELARLYGTDVPVTVVGPLLSRLKRAGEVVNEGHRWRLTRA